MLPAFKKIFIVGFYRANSGMFLFALLFLFGMMRISDHVLIAGFFLSEKILLLIPFGIWMLYNVNVLSFYIRTFKLPDNSFLGIAMLIHPHRKFRTSLFLQTAVFLPMILYIIFLSTVAAMNSLFGTILLLFISLSLLLFLNTSLFYYLLNKPFHRQNSIWERVIKISIPGIRNLYPFQYCNYVLRADTVKLLFSKFLSVITILVTLYLYKSDDYRISVVTIGALISITFNGLLIYGMHDFYENQYRITRNLPYRKMNRFLMHTLILIILLIPECFVFLRNFSIPGIGRTTELIGFYSGIAILIKSLMLIKPLQPESYLKYAGYGFILFTFLLLYRPPLFLLALVPLFSGALLYNFYYYKYEPVISRSEALP